MSGGPSAGGDVWEADCTGDDYGDAPPIVLPVTVTDAADLPEVDPTDIFKGHFRLNPAALESVLRPMLREIMSETHINARLSSLEHTVSKQQVAIEQKADGARFGDAVAQLQEHRGILHQKADQRALNEISMSLGNVEETLTWKADQVHLEEIAARVERVKNLSVAKADLSYVNRTNSTVAKVTSAMQQQEQVLQDVTAMLQKLDISHLPGQAQKAADALRRLQGEVRKLQDAMSMKAEQSGLQDAYTILRDVETSLSSKVSGQRMSEVMSEMHDMQHQFAMKADQSGLEDVGNNLEQMAETMRSKADQCTLNESIIMWQGMQQSFDQKADLLAFGDAKTRLMSLEAKFETKADRHEFNDMHSAVELLQCASAAKTDRCVFNDLAERMALAERDISQKAELGAFNHTNDSVRHLEYLLDAKADRKLVADRIDDVTARYETLVQRLRTKADHSRVEDTAATLHILAHGLGTPRAGGVGRDSSPRMGGHDSSPRMSGVPGSPSPSSTSGSLHSAMASTSASTVCPSPRLCSSPTPSARGKAGDVSPRSMRLGTSRGARHVKSQW